jgi:mono/diheme cytochrome c family protein
LGQVHLIELEIPKVNLNDPQTVSRGKQVFVQHCGRCHTVSGLTEATLKGPELTRVAAVAASRRPDLSAEDYIRESFLIPNAYWVDGFEPQTVGQVCGGVISQREFDEVVAFLLSLK